MLQHRHFQCQRYKIMLQSRTSTLAAASLSCTTMTHATSARFHFAARLFSYTGFICLDCKLGAFAMHAYTWVMTMFKSSSVCLVDTYGRCIMTTLKRISIMFSTLKGGCWSKNYFAHFSTQPFHCTFIMISMKKYGKKKKKFRGWFPWKWWPYSILGHSPRYT